MDSIEISTNVSGSGRFSIPKDMNKNVISSLMEMGMPRTEKKINKIKNGAIYQAKSMGWIGDEYPYLDDTEEKIDTEINDNETDNTYTTNNDDNINVNNSSNNSNSSDSSGSSNTNQRNQTSYVTVPNLVGLNYDVALSKMSECKITQDWNPEYIYTSKASKNNTIAEQSLKVGSEVEEWASIDLKIYKYSDNATVRIPLYVVGKNVNIEEMARTRNSN